METAKILIVDDNAEILSANREYLSGQGFDVSCADTGRLALALLGEGRYDCVVLDVLLPDMDGFTVCKSARALTDTPIIFLSCLEEVDDKVRGLMSGGDDYMTKPYSLKELGARLRCVMRRARGEGRESPRGEFYIDRGNRIIHALGRNALLSEREFGLFTLLYENPGAVFTREDLLARIWGGGAEASVVAVLVSRLKRKIGFAAGVVGSISSAYGAGYSLAPPPERAVGKGAARG